jgi:lysophospholipase L1-like esterase
MLLAIASAVVALAAVEVALRLSGLAPSAGLFTVTEKEFERIPGIFAPGQQVVEGRGTRFEHTVRIDSLGYRGRDFPRSKPPGEPRVVLAGDSFTYGHNVDDHETLPAQLEAWLVRRCGSATVVNAGLSGSTILGQEAMIRRAKVLDPDVVVLVYHENDLDELARVRIWERLAENRRAKSRFPLGLVYPWARHSAVWNLVQDVRSRWLNRPGGPLQAGTEGLADVELERARREYRARLDAVASFLAERRIGFLFVAFPHPRSVEQGAGGRDYDWVLATAAELEIATVDLLPELRSSGSSIEALYLLPEDYHPSPEGHELAAERLGPPVLTALPEGLCGGA